MKNAIAYERVSTAGQGRSGLGLKAQHATIARFATQEGFRIVESFTEAETGKGAELRASASQSLHLVAQPRTVTGGRPYRRWVIASGRTVEGGERSEVTELWTFLRARCGNWLLSAIQQT